ncbi:hypothetical protein [Pseudomonas veronii]
MFSNLELRWPLRFLYFPSTSIRKCFAQRRNCERTISFQAQIKTHESSLFHGCTLAPKFLSAIFSTVYLASGLNVCFWPILLKKSASNSAPEKYALEIEI